MVEGMTFQRTLDTPNLSYSILKYYSFFLIGKSKHKFYQVYDRLNASGGTMLSSLLFKQCPQKPKNVSVSAPNLL